MKAALHPDRASSPPFGTEIAPPGDLEERRAGLLSAFGQRIMVLDGAMGTALQACSLTAEDFGGPAFEGCNEILCRTRPDIVDRVHDAYLRAGADIVETNSFGGTGLVLAEYGLETEAFDLNRRAAEIARKACLRHSTPERPRFVCGSMGPTTKAITVTGGITFDQLLDYFRIQALGLVAGGADYLVLETCQDLLNTKAGLLGITKAFEQVGWQIPVAVTVTIETNGTMLGGQDAEAVVVSLAHADLLYIGLNCATGPDLMREDLRTISDLARTRAACVPNAGLPDENGCYLQGPEDFTKILGDYLDQGWLNLIGGCCGTTADHVAALANLVNDRRPRQVPDHKRCMVSGLQTVELTEQNRPLLVGERTNVLGSRAFKRLIAEDDLDGAAEVGRAQVLKGAQIIDVCLQDPEIDEKERMTAFLQRLNRRIRVPLMIDSTDPEVMEAALKNGQGKAVLNSTNLEDGPERFGRVADLARTYGAALIVGTIDERGMAVTIERKLEVARRSFRILIDEHGFRPEDIWWDTLVFPCATGDEQYLGAAGLTLAGLGRLKSEFPGTRTLLGISNVGFGLPTAGREVLNAVFLYRATKAGLDAAIVNTQRLARYAEIPEKERFMAETLLGIQPGEKSAGEKAVADFTEYFRGRKPAETSTEDRAGLDVAQRLSRAVVEGNKTCVEEDLTAALEDERWPLPLDIINGPLMDGMAEVGRLFNDNQLIVAEVLQSAEVMEAAVSFLEPDMERADFSSRGKVLLATVKGDVHDIGKNLVSIVLGNNGFEIMDLGIRVTNERLVQAADDFQPDVIGLSGLLVKSAHQMILTAEDLRAAEISTPLLVGGAALTRRFTHLKIAGAYDGLCTYGRDAMHALELVDRLTDVDKRVRLETEINEAVRADQGAKTPDKQELPAQSPKDPPAVSRRIVAPQPPDLERHIAALDLDEVWTLLNPQMLYGKHLGLKGSIRRLEKEGDAKLAMLRSIVHRVQEDARSGGMTARAAWRFFPVRTDGDDLCLLDPDSRKVTARWTMPRQAGDSGLCITDYVLDNDHVALFVTTAGQGIRTQVAQLKDRGEYLKSHILASLAIETAEAAAEWLHMRLRTQWGFPDTAETNTRDRLAGRYRGKRFSFGYPACPDLKGQRQLFAALMPEEIGVELTEGDMMDPEATVSALVFHHPDARYFSV
ncbi:MAG: methionine synthase [Acidobacteriota bacterium]